MLVQSEQDSLDSAIRKLDAEKATAFTGAVEESNDSIVKKTSRLKKWKIIKNSFRGLRLVVLTRKEDFISKSVSLSDLQVILLDNNSSTGSSDSMKPDIMTNKPRRYNMKYQQTFVKRMESFLVTTNVVPMWTRFEPILMNRRMSLAFTQESFANTSHHCQYRTIHIRSSWAQETIPKSRNLYYNVDYAALADVLAFGGSVLLVTLDAYTDSVLFVWFLYENADGAVSKALHAVDSSKFADDVRNNKAVVKDRIDLMKRFAYDMTTVEGFRGFQEAFADWCRRSKGRPLQFWNDDASQIQGKTFLIESAAFLAVQDSLRDCVVERRSLESVDLVITLPTLETVGCKSMNVKTDGRVCIRRRGHPPCSRNEVDAFVFPIATGDDKCLKASWTRVCVLSSREDPGLVHLHTIQVDKSRKVYGKCFDLSDETGIVAELRRCKSIPLLPQDAIEQDMLIRDG